MSIHRIQGCVLGIVLATATVGCSSAGEIEGWIEKNMGGSIQSLGSLPTSQLGTKGGTINKGAGGGSSDDGSGWNDGKGGANSPNNGSGGAQQPDDEPQQQNGTGGTTWGGGPAGGPSGTGGSTQNAGGGTPGMGGMQPAAGGAAPGTGGARPATGGSNLGRGGAAPGTGGAPAAGGSPAGVGGSSSGGTPVSVKKFVGNITTGDSVDTDGKVFSKYWDQITPENAGKWGSVQSSAGAAFNWKTLDAIYSYTEKNNVIFKQHTFVWGSQQPGGTISEANVKSWMSEFCKRYPHVKVIDVVNEPPPHTTPSYANNIGGGTNGTWQWIINAFKWAREACPGAILVLNDYNNIEWSNDASHFIDIVKTAKAGGAPIDAVGAQSHDLDHASVTLSSVKTLLSNLHTQTGLPVYITELDLSTSDDNSQLNMYKQYIPLFLEAEYVQGITIWGWIYGKTWSQAPDSGLIRNGTARPAMTWLMQQLGRPAP